jgi:PAS domain S-box-containing protein
MARVGRQTDDERSDIRVLHVDDDAEFADLAKTFLQRESDRLQVTTVPDATAGLAALADGDVDCVVSDYDMPDQDGIEFLESVRETHPDVPFILYTGKGSEEIASEAISAGVTDYLQKQTGTNQYALLANRIENAVERNRSRRELAERNRRLETLIQNLPGMVYRCANEPNWPMEFVGGECEALTGYSARAFETRDGLWGNEIIHPDDRERVWEVVQDCLEAERPFELTYRIVTRDGTVKDVWERGCGIYGPDGTIEALEGFITDITEQKRYERELERSNAHLEALFENSPDMINIHDGDGIIVDANRRLCEELGYDREDLVGMGVWDVDVEASRADVEGMRRELGRTEREQLETTYERADGTRFPAEVHLSKLPLDDQDRFVVVSRDLSEREARQRELRRLTAEYETVFEHARDAIFLVDVERTDDGLELVYRRRNDAHESVTGVTEQVRGSTPADIFDQSLSSELREHYHDCVETATAQTFEVDVESGGEVKTVNVRLSPVVVDGVVTQVVGISRPVAGTESFE